MDKLTETQEPTLINCPLNTGIRGSNCANGFLLVPTSTNWT